MYGGTASNYPTSIRIANWRWLMRDMSQPIYLFLDFDGVLHHDCVYRDKAGEIYLPIEGRSLFEHAHHLVEVLKPHPEVVLVLSTNWVRLLGGYPEVRDRLPAPLADRAVGATWIERTHPVWFQQATRYEQIIETVKREGIARWLALDNDDELWPNEHRWNLIHTDDDRGISERRKQAELAEKIEALKGGK